MSCNIRVGKPKVMQDKDSVVRRADNLNRNFDDIWRYFEQFRKCTDSLSNSISSRSSTVINSLQPDKKALAQANEARRYALMVGA